MISELKDHWEYENGPIVMRRKVYYKSDVDAVIAEKDRALEFAKALTLKDIKIIEEKDKEIAELKARLVSTKENRCASVDAGTRERRLERALWLARAESAMNAKYRYHRLTQKEVCDPQPHGWCCYINGEVYPTGKMARRLEPHYWCDVWEDVERRCRAKAEECK